MLKALMQERSVRAVTLCAATLTRRGIATSTSAEQPAPAIEGLEVRIRCDEASSRQVRQVTVRHTFVPH
jgi:hypothetical protein